jgi:hypothetical protein
MGQRRLNILVVYVMNKYPMRATLWDQLYCFQRYSNHNCFYLNLSVRRAGWYLKKIKFDLIIFGTLFLANRMVAEWFEPILNKARDLKSLNAVKIAFPQDEHAHTAILSDFIREFDIDCIFSVAPESEWPMIYEGADMTKAKLFGVLTGYLDDTTIARINLLGEEVNSRNIDLGYRTFRAAPSLGRHGLMRQQIADLFQEKAPARGLITDISTRREDTLWGDAWYKFLLRCKYTMSVEGGASVLDRDGTILLKTQDYLERHPQATFAEVEEACFPGLDGKLHYAALSPRHLEACATRTCQILVAGRYNDVLVPGRHYIELNGDLGNIDQVLDIVKQDQVRHEITERAYREIVESARYTYRNYVDFVLRSSLPNSENESASVHLLRNGLVYYWMRLSDFFAWVQVALRLHSFGARVKGKLRRVLASAFSEEAVASVLRRFRQSGEE